MPLIDLAFASGEDSLSVRCFTVREQMSSLFVASIEACSPNEDIDLESIAGNDCTLRIATGVAQLRRDARQWAGICHQIEQVRAEPTGLSTYRLRIAPRLWLLAQRRNYRVFQHLSVPEIAATVLAEWRIEAVWEIDRTQHPKLEIRIQYGESDYAFLSRLLEEAGISFSFRERDSREPVLVLHDRPHTGNPREGGPIAYADNPNQSAEEEYLTEVVLTQEVRPGRYAVRDHDFRRSHEYRLIAEAGKAAPPEDALEHYHYSPGSFLVEVNRSDDTPVADHKGAARHDDRAGRSLAERSFEALRASRRVVAFKTNVPDLSPGVLFSMRDHPRSDLAPDKLLLVTEFSVQGTPGGEWTMQGQAVFADKPYRPPKVTPKPQIHSVQSAIVVGPKGEEIHTDEFGRVRVQFHWDRVGSYDDQSSCWMRVSQGWAGRGFGQIAIPRVGQEVLVGFLEGDPDQPVVVGRLYNNTSRVPYKLPEQKTISGWKSDSSPGSNGFNEIRFDDAKGRELVHVQAERVLTKLVKLEEIETTGVTRLIQVGQKLTLTTGEASIILDGPNITITAAGMVKMNSSGSDVIIEGGPEVKINPLRDADPEDEGDDEDDDDEDDDDEPEQPDEDDSAAGDAAGPGPGHARENVAEGIDVMGTGEFRDATLDELDKLAETRTGAALLKGIARSGKTVTIVETRSGSGACKPEKIEDANRTSKDKPGKGSNSTVAFNPRHVPEGASSTAALGNSLAHAYHNALGQREPGTTDGVKDADRQAIGLRPYGNQPVSENKLRRELKLPKRTNY